MSILGIYIFNSTRNKWLQGNLKSWGPFESAFEWSDTSNVGYEAAESARVGLLGDDTTYTMAALH